MLAIKSVQTPLRTLTRKAPLARHFTSNRVQRTFHSSRINRDGHASAHSSSEEGEEEYPTEGEQTEVFSFVSPLG